MRNLTQLDWLEEYLKTNGISYVRVDLDDEDLDRHDYCRVKFDHHQLIIYDERGDRLWDAICQRGSYGAEEGLLEIYGEIVNPMAGDSVEGWLTAKDVIERIEQRKGAKEKR